MKWGILATGNIAQKFADTIAQMKDPNEQLLAVGSRSRERGQQFAQEHGVPRFYDSYEALLGDSEIEAVYIATPNRLHAEDCRMCLLAGKHVLCEKPFTMKASQAKELYELAKEKGLFLMEAFWIRFLPMYRQLRALLEKGEIGEIRHAVSHFGFVASGIRRERKLRPDLGGGALLDVGIYNLGFLQMIVRSMPEDFRSEMEKNEFGTDSYSTIYLRYPGGVEGRAVQAADRQIDRLAVITGTDGTITLPDFQHAQTMTVAPKGRDPYEISIPFEVNGFEYEIREVSRCVSNGQGYSSLYTPQENVELLELMENIRASWGMA